MATTCLCIVSSVSAPDNCIFLLVVGARHVCSYAPDNHHVAPSGPWTAGRQYEKHRSRTGKPQKSTERIGPLGPCIGKTSPQALQAGIHSARRVLVVVISRSHSLWRPHRRNKLKKKSRATKNIHDSLQLTSTCYCALSQAVVSVSKSPNQQGYGQYTSGPISMGTPSCVNASAQSASPSTNGEAFTSCSANECLPAHP